MANYWFHLIPWEECDETLKATYNYYTICKPYNSTIDLYQNSPIANLGSVKAGDVVFVCAHGHEQRGYVTNRRSMNEKGCKRYEFSAIFHAFNTLRSGSRDSPISIKLLVCWAGGKSLTDQQLRDFYIFDRRVGSEKTDSWYLKMDNRNYRRWANELPIDEIDNRNEFERNITLAKKLAIEIGKTREHIYVGGYPGKLAAHKQQTKLVEVPHGEPGQEWSIDISESFRHAAVWFGQDGKVYVRRKSVHNDTQYRFKPY